MAGLVKKFLASASVVAGMSAVFVAPAMAATFSPIGTDLILRTYDEDNGFEITNDLGQLDSILQGDSSNPGGNVELGSKDDGSNPLAGVQAENSEGKIATFTNVTQDVWGNGDGSWVSDPNSWLNTIGRSWFSDLFEQIDLELAYIFLGIGSGDYGQDLYNTAVSYYNTYYSYYENLGHTPEEISNIVWEGTTEQMNNTIEAGLYSLFASGGGFGLVTDPNISYIYEDGADIKVGLAGHYNLKNRALAGDNADIVGMANLFDGVRISEIFAYNINGDTGYGWSTDATQTGLADDDKAGSYSGNFEVTLTALANASSFSEDVPEPSTVLGLMAIGGLIAATKRKSQK